MTKEFSINDYIVMLFNDTTFINENRLSPSMTLTLNEGTIEAPEGTLLFVESIVGGNGRGQLKLGNYDISILLTNVDNELVNESNIFCNSIDSTVNTELTINFKLYIKQSM